MYLISNLSYGTADSGSLEPSNSGYDNSGYGNSGNGNSGNGSENDGSTDSDPTSTRKVGSDSTALHNIEKNPIYKYKIKPSLDSLAIKTVIHIS